jgi:hypothetical protein
MDELTERLKVDLAVIIDRLDPTLEELRERTGDLVYVLIRFTETRGGTELAFPLDREATDLSVANFDTGIGTVHVEGNLTLDGDPFRCVADIDLARVKGTGRLALDERGTRRLSGGHRRAGRGSG